MVVRAALTATVSPGWVIPSPLESVGSVSSGRYRSLLELVAYSDVA
jgi:hypothetical protein